MEILINILRNTSKVQDEDILFRELESFGTNIHRHMIEIQIRSCPYTQLCNVHREAYDYPGYLDSCCGACSCDLEVCLDTNNCCLDIILNYSTQFPPQTKLSKSCIPLEIGQTSGVGYRSHMYAVSSCTRHKDQSEYININKCENKYVAGGVGSVIDIVPCFDRLNRTLFRNRHCAYCNGVLDVDLEYFNTSLTCETLIDGSRDETVLLDKILEKRSCKIAFHPEPEFEIYSCTGAVNSCNQTGLWTIYNADIEAACLAYTSVYSLDSLSELSRFKNIFCYICNGYDPNDLRQLCQIPYYMDKHSEIFSFSGLLNVQRSLDDMSAVRVNENPDEENTFCSIARSLVGEKCVPMSATDWNILIFLDIRAIPEQLLYVNMSEIDSMLLRLYDAIKDKFGPGFDDDFCSRGASADIHASAETMLSSESFVNVVKIDFCIPLYVSAPIEIDLFFNIFREAFQNVKLNVFLGRNKPFQFSLNIIDKSNHPYDYLGDKGLYKRSTLGEFGALADIPESVGLPPVQKNVKKERNDLEIFVKLSTITGMTWIFGLINSVTQISFFSYLFIVLNACQGVFLFFAFICNRR
ncbi:hypothetical protein MAR_029920, partial [Mya arenaria]